MNNKTRDEMNLILGRVAKIICVPKITLTREFDSRRKAPDGDPRGHWVGTIAFSDEWNYDTLVKLVKVLETTRLDFGSELNHDNCYYPDENPGTETIITVRWDSEEVKIEKEISVLARVGKYGE